MNIEQADQEGFIKFKRTVVHERYVYRLCELTLIKGQRACRTEIISGLFGSLIRSRKVNSKSVRHSLIEGDSQSCVSGIFINGDVIDRNFWRFIFNSDGGLVIGENDVISIRLNLGQVDQKRLISFNSQRVKDGNGNRFRLFLWIKCNCTGLAQVIVRTGGALVDGGIVDRDAGINGRVE